jgi:hypothetical protein
VNNSVPKSPRTKPFVGVLSLTSRGKNCKCRNKTLCLTFSRCCRDTPLYLDCLDFSYVLLQCCLSFHVLFYAEGGVASLHNLGVGGVAYHVFTSTFTSSSLSSHKIKIATTTQTKHINIKQSKSRIKLQLILKYNRKA